MVCYLQKSGLLVVGLLAFLQGKGSHHQQSKEKMSYINHYLNTSQSSVETLKEIIDKLAWGYEIEEV